MSRSPLSIVAEPANGPDPSALETLLNPKGELALDLAGIHGIATIVVRSIRLQLINGLASTGED
jgi:hypothetical protein